MRHNLIIVSLLFALTLVAIPVANHHAVLITGDTPKGVKENIFENILQEIIKKRYL